MVPRWGPANWQGPLSDSPGPDAAGLGRAGPFGAMGQLGVLAKRIAPLCRLGSAPRRHGVDGRHLAGSPLWHLQAAAHDKLKHSKVAGLMKGYNWAWAHMAAHGGVGCVNPM